MASKGRTLLFVAEGTNSQGERDSVWVYKQGSSFHLSGSGVPGFNHLCHPSVRDQEGVKREILLVYQIKVDKLIQPSDLNGR